MDDLPTPVQEPGPPNPKAKVEVLLDCLYAMVFLAYSIVWVGHVFFFFQDPFQYDYGEGMNTFFALAMKSGFSVYMDAFKPPYWMFPYTPLSIWLQSEAMRFLGPFPAGRFVASMSATLLAVALGIFGYRKLGLRPTFIMLALLLADPVFLTFCCFCRPDATALALAGFGLILAGGTPTKRRDFLAAVCLTLAFFTKQSYLAAPIAILISRLNKRRELKRFALYYFTLLVVGILIADIRTGGELPRTLFQRMRLPYHVDSLISNFTDYVPFLIVPLCIVIPRLKRLPGMWVAFLVLSTGMIVGMGVQGAIHNYFLEFHLAVSVLTAMAYANWKPRPPGLDLLLLLHLILPTGFVGIGYFRSVREIVQDEYLPWRQGLYPPAMAFALERQAAIDPVLELRPAILISEYASAPVIRGLPMIFVEPSSYLAMSRLGIWDEQPIIDLVNNEQVDLILLENLGMNPRFSDRFLAATREHYVEIKNALGLHALAPKHRAAEYLRKLHGRL